MKQNYVEYTDGSATYKMWIEDEKSITEKIGLAKKYDLPIRQLTYLPKSETIEYTTNYEIPLMRVLPDSSVGPKGVVDLFTNEDLKGEGFFEWLGHPGYVDWDLMQLSSLTLGRCSGDIRRLEQRQVFKKVIEYIKENNIELITYLDLPKR